MKIVFYGNRQAGLIAFLALKAMRRGFHADIVEVWTDTDEFVKWVAPHHDGPVKLFSVHNYMAAVEPPEADLLVCVHGRRIVPKQVLDAMDCVNLHPYLKDFPGASPVELAIASALPYASVSAHYMTTVLDMGDVITTLTTDRDRLLMKPVEVYNLLYPLYAQVVVDAVEKVQLRHETSAALVGSNP